MNSSPRQTPVQPVARALPWSTRAVILLAFAIQLGSLGEGAGQGATRPSDCLRMCDGQLLTIWLDDASQKAVPAAGLSGGAGAIASPDCHVLASLAPATTHASLAQVSSAVLPMPPPTVC